MNKGKNLHNLREILKSFPSLYFGIDRQLSKLMCDTNFQPPSPNFQPLILSLL